MAAHTVGGLKKGDKAWMWLRNFREDKPTLVTIDEDDNIDSGEFVTMMPQRRVTIDPSMGECKLFVDTYIVFYSEKAWDTEEEAQEYISIEVEKAKMQERLDREKIYKDASLFMAINKIEVPDKESYLKGYVDGVYNYTKKGF